MKVLKTSGLLVKKTGEPHESKIKESLTRRSKDYQSKSWITTVFYLEDSKHLLLPRFFPIEKYLENPQIVNRSCEGGDIEISHQIEPRNDLQDKAMRFMSQHNSGILQLQPGSGKTVITIHYIANTKKKSFVLVHRDSLVTQWIERFKQFTNIEDDRIGRLYSSNYKEALQKDIIISTNQTILSMIGSKNHREFLQAFQNANIGVFIADEVHTTVGAAKFSQCSMCIPASRVFGLSATPYRWDGNEDIIQFHLGSIYKDESTAGTMEAKVVVFLVDYQIDTLKSQKYLRWEGQFQRARYLNMMVKSLNFLNCAKGVITKSIEDKRHSILVSERIKLVELLYNWLDYEDKSKFTGSAGNEELEKRFTFATPQKIRDGVDAPQKDFLIMTSPIGNIEQLAGRVVRSKEGKKQPIIIDIVDRGCSEIFRTLFKRLGYYNSKGWEIDFYIMVDSKPQKIDQDVVNQMYYE